MGTIELNGKLCAGSLVCRFGDDIFSLLNAHDPEMNKLGLGKLSRHLMILEAIRSGARRFHLLGGYFNSKRPFGARRIPLYALLVYRRRFGMVKDAGTLLKLLLKSLDYQLRTLIE
ncbi:MAG: GNAT family N-acetyltransferase, partial [Betaproteobacteria bacterium]